MCTYDGLFYLIHLLRVFSPDTHIPVNEHATTLFVDEDIATANIAMKDLSVFVRGTVSWKE